MHHRRVCTKEWKGIRKEAFYFVAKNSAKPVSLTPDGTKTFPFVEGPCTVPANGEKLFHLIDQAGKFTYYAKPCVQSEGNPRTVIIT